jgi:hypothetical protein
MVAAFRRIAALIAWGAIASAGPARADGPTMFEVDHALQARRPIREAIRPTAPEALEIAPKLAGIGITGAGAGRVIGSRPNRENDEAVEWRVDVKDGSAPETGFLQPAALQAALAKIGSQLGPEARFIRLVVGSNRIWITIGDPRQPGKLTAYQYVDGVVSERDDPTFDAINRGFDDQWFWRLDAVTPAFFSALAALEARAKSRVDMPAGVIELITFSKDRRWHPTNTELFVEVRVVADGNRRDITRFGLDGRDLSPDDLNR